MTHVVNVALTPEHATKIKNALAAERSRTGVDPTHARAAQIIEAILAGRTPVLSEVARPNTTTITESAPDGAGKVRIDHVTDASLRDMIAETARKAIAEALRRQQASEVAEAVTAAPVGNVAAAWVAGRTGAARNRGAWGHLLAPDAQTSAKPLAEMSDAELAADVRALFGETTSSAAPSTAPAPAAPSATAPVPSKPLAEMTGDDLDVEVRRLLSETGPAARTFQDAFGKRSPSAASIAETPVERAASILASLGLE